MLRIRLRSLVILTALLTRSDFALAGSGFNLGSYTISAGGGLSNGGGYTLRGTIGQPDAGTVTGGLYVLHGGFWHGGEAPVVCPSDLDGDSLVGAPDLAVLLGAWGPTTPCPPTESADLNQDCAVNAADLAILLGSWGPCL